MAITLFIAAPVAAQQHSGTDSIMLGAIVENKDTIPMIYLPEFIKTEKLTAREARRYAKQREYDATLRYNVYKVYPYAVIAADLLKNVDTDLDKIDGRSERKAYLKSVEKELNKRFKGELEDLTITQGQILVRLIDRQTGKNCYSIIQEVKGGFSAVIWQSVALIFSNNLKREYDPTDRDKDIEAVVRELEASNYNKYQYYQQQTRLHK
ncbi:MAG: DUF4294 domain-containing protein [Flavipsychrobacter sp.]|nr:DUF4294 domain-containing protein [Flavipsychrobacter sp.]